jgi:hypothetical protein
MTRRYGNGCAARFRAISSRCDLRVAAGQQSSDRYVAVTEQCYSNGEIVAEPETA